MNAIDLISAPAMGHAWAIASRAPAKTDESLAGRAEVALLTKDGADFRRIGVDAVAGVITLRGKVGTESEKNEAAAAVRRVTGVSEVNNQLEVAPEPVARRAIRR